MFRTPVHARLRNTSWCCVPSFHSFSHPLSSQEGRGGSNPKGTRYAVPRGLSQSLVVLVASHEDGKSPGQSSTDTRAQRSGSLRVWTSS